MDSSIMIMIWEDTCGCTSSIFCTNMCAILCTFGLYKEEYVVIICLPRPGAPTSNRPRLRKLPNVGVSAVVLKECGGQRNPCRQAIFVSRYSRLRSPRVEHRRSRICFRVEVDVELSWSISMTTASVRNGTENCDNKVVLD